MSWHPIDNVARALVLARIQDATWGLTPQLVASCANYGSLTAADYDINFASGNNSFFQGDVDPDDVMGAEDVTYPALVLVNEGFVPNSESEARTFGTMASGGVSICLRYYIAWPNENTPHDLETPCDAIQEAFFKMFNTPSGPGLWAITPPVTTTNVTYDFLMSCVRGPITQMGDNLRRLIEFRMRFGVDSW